MDIGRAVQYPECTRLWLGAIRGRCVFPRRRHQVSPHWALADRVARIGLPARDARVVSRSPRVGPVIVGLGANPSLSGSSGVRAATTCLRFGIVQGVSAQWQGVWGEAPWRHAALVLCALRESSLHSASPDACSYRADLELVVDLVCGQVHPGHWLWGGVGVNRRGGAGRPRQRATGGAPTLLIHRVRCLQVERGYLTLC